MHSGQLLLTLLSFEHNTARTLTRKAQDLSDSFHGAVDMSVQTAQAGHDFCSDMQLLCKALLDPRKTSDDIRDSINKMKVVAECALKAAQNTSQKFGNVLTRVYEVCSLLLCHTTMKLIKHPSSRSGYDQPSLNCVFTRNEL